MICEKAYYKDNGDLYPKLYCTDERNTDFAGKCPLIYWCSINERYENTSDSLQCVYRRNTTNESVLVDTLDKIKRTIEKYGEKNFYLSFSGGKDSTILSHLIDMAIPSNSIPRVYADTGIELNMIRDYVRNLSKKDERIVIISPSQPIKAMLECEGYPFKSKIHSHCVNLYQIGSDNKMVLGYLGQRPDTWHSRICPKILRYQFTEQNGLRISDRCCERLKEEPLLNFSKQTDRKISIIGTMRAEGGRRSNLQCLLFVGKQLKKFQPMVDITKDWENWLIKTRDIDICDIYKSPYNFERTGCKGCPFALNLQHELDVLEKFFPNERRQCERIWKPVYDEYRRIGYRLKQEG